MCLLTATVDHGDGFPFTRFVIYGACRLRVSVNIVFMILNAYTGQVEV